jgi:hypothetical protein
MHSMSEIDKQVTGFTPHVPPRFAVTAERTKLSSEDPSGESDRTWECQVWLHARRTRDNQVLVQMDGGPTGNESFVATPRNMSGFYDGRNWVACEGVRGAWDRLVVPSHEIVAFLMRVGLISTLEVAA